MCCGDEALALYGHARVRASGGHHPLLWLQGGVSKRRATTRAYGDEALALDGYSRIRASGGAVGPLSGGPLPTPALQGLCP